MDKFKGATILLPAMDETYSLEQTVNTIMQTCNKADLKEIIIIVCEKNTAQCVLTAGEVESQYGALIPVNVRFQSKPFVGGAVQEGFDVATGSHVVLMSSDLETDPHLVAEFIRIAKESPAKIVTATRWRKGGGFVGYNKVKLVANLIFQKLISALFLSGLSDLIYGYRIFPACLVKAIRWEEAKHPFFLETALKPIRLGVEFVEVPTLWQARTEGASVNSFWANFKYFKTACHVRFMKKQDILR